ncbi:unnamed protein product [Thelazia callipaeda]|uniref:Stromal cell-derived factor 4 n=1 Tax=Thelazia callipaeda TaxID=103827 RepID=A0A0N5CX70_THECL|nr:unnamed protein product [Thelazia callipaeda]
MKLFGSSNLRKISYRLLILIWLLTVVKSDEEHVEHGFSKEFIKEHDGYVVSNEYLDQESVKDGERQIERLDDLSPEEAKIRMAILARKMDLNNDGYVTKDELQSVVKHFLNESNEALVITYFGKKINVCVTRSSNVIAMDLEESNNRFRDIDTNQDNIVTWDEYVKETFGDIKLQDENIDADDKRLMEDDRKLFRAADDDGDGSLTIEEFQAFQNPESFPQMHFAFMEVTIAEKDANMDGKISLEEFLDDAAKSKDSEWRKVEKERFARHFDRDHDGFLVGTEILDWLQINLDSNAAEEAEHLVSRADKDLDGRLSIEEIVGETDLFVRSDATNNGESLMDIHHDEL